MAIDSNFTAGARSIFGLEGMRVLVSGAAGGIGSATAKLCATLGAELFLVDVHSPQSVADEINNAGGTAEALEADLSEPLAISEIMQRCGSLDAAVLSHGIYEPVDWDTDNWDEILDRSLTSNLTGSCRLAHAVCEAMASRKHGRVILLGSIVATTGGSFAGVGPHYAVAKGGVHTLTRWLAARYGASGVLVNGVAPGTVATPMLAAHDLDPVIGKIPLKRAAEPEEIAGPIAFLCSPAASYITGAIIDVNGGVLMRP